jgi:hypothetical protein
MTRDICEKPAFPFSDPAFGLQHRAEIGAGGLTCESTWGIAFAISGRGREAGLVSRRFSAILMDLLRR